MRLLAASRTPALDIHKIKGRLKEAAGVLTGNDSLKREGQRDQVVGEAKDKVERAVERAKNA